jgi:uncharacterized protein
MKFYNREKEINLLKDLKKDFRIAIIGRRRIGKTSLVKKIYPNCIELFISAEKTEKSNISDWISEYPNYNFPPIYTFREFFEFLFQYKNEYIIFIDELQNAIKVNNSFFSDLQKLIDKYKPRLIVSGSYLSLMKNILQEYKVPLYGRFDFIINLDELNIITVIKICKDLKINFENSLNIYFIFGGIPKYYELIEKTGFKNINLLINMFYIEYPRPLFEEIRVMLKEEFGSEYKMYFSILQSISLGKNNLSEISNYLGISKTNLTKYLHNLEYDYEIIRRIIPLYGSKKGIYILKNNIFKFWFLNIWKYNNYFESLQEDKLKNKINLNRYFGYAFEDLILNNFNLFNFKYDQIGKQWGKFKGIEGQNTYEIDIVATNDKEILFCECKYKDNVDAEKIYNELKEKSKYVNWNNENRIEHFAIFAKSFKNKIKIKNLKLYDLKDIEKSISK